MRMFFGELLTFFGVDIVLSCSPFKIERYSKVTENPNYEEMDKVLVEIGNMGKNFLHLKGINPLYIDLWRWDAPETAFWWIDPAGLNKRAVFTVDETDGRYSVRASASAWLDNRETLKRKWVGITFTPSLAIGGPELSDSVRRKFLDLFETIFQKISSVEEKDLVNESYLRPLPNM